MDYDPKGKQISARYYFFFLINYFMQSAVGIVYEPVNYILKDHLHFTPGQASGFMAWITFPLLLKPLYGYVTDFVPLGRYRRKPHLALAACLAAGAFFILAAQTQYHYLSLLIPLTVSIFAMAFADAVCGGWLVEDGKERQQTGPYQALHIGALYLGVILVGAGGGWMTSHIPYPWIFGIAGLMPLCIFGAVFLIHEGPTDLFGLGTNDGLLVELRSHQNVLGPGIDHSVVEFLSLPRDGSVLLPK